MKCVLLPGRSCAPRGGHLLGHCCGSGVRGAWWRGRRQAAAPLRERPGEAPRRLRHPRLRHRPPAPSSVTSRRPWAEVSRRAGRLPWFHGRRPAAAAVGSGAPAMSAPPAGAAGPRPWARRLAPKTLELLALPCAWRSRSPSTGEGRWRVRCEPRLVWVQR